MPNTEKAGTSLPQNCPELEPFIKAQAHIRAAARIIDRLTAHPLNQMEEKEQDSFRNLAEECRSHMWEVDSQVQELTTAFFAPLFPINKE